MRAVDSWFEAAKRAYEGDGMDPLIDRVFRAKGEGDARVFDFLILEELRLLRVAVVETLRRQTDATKGSAKR